MSSIGVNSFNYEQYRVLNYIETKMMMKILKIQKNDAKFNDEQKNTQFRM